MVENVYVVSKRLYNYRENSNGIMNVNFNIKRLDCIEAIRERLNFFESKKEKKLYDLTFICLLDSLIRYYTLVRKNIKDNKKIQKDLINLYKTEYKKLNIKVNFKRKIKYFLFNYFYDIYYFLWLILKTN